MSLPAIRAVRESFPGAHLTLLARPSVAGLYARERTIDQVLLYTGNRSQTAADLRGVSFDCAILLPNSFDSALLAWKAAIPRRIGYKRDMRGWLLTDAIATPESGEIPTARALLLSGVAAARGGDRRISAVPRNSARGARASQGSRHVRCSEKPAFPSRPSESVREQPTAMPSGGFRSVSPKPPSILARTHPASIILFGSAAERPLCANIAEQLGAAGLTVHNFAGETTLDRFIDLTAACRMFLSNDSGAMHVASALGVPTVTVFGATDDTTTGPTGPWARIVREPVECSPCLWRECPIDHRCMTRVTAERVANVAMQLWEETAH